jgi:hypothetical protein
MKKNKRVSDSRRKLGGSTAHKSKNIVNDSTTNENKAIAETPVQDAEITIGGGDGRVQAPFHDKHQASIDFKGSAYRLAKLWMQLLTALWSLIFSGVVGILFGFNTLIPPPILDVVHQHPTISIATIGFLIIITFLAWFKSRETPSQDDGGGSKRYTPQYIRGLIIATTVSTSSSILCLVLLAVILIQPPWCPTFLCPAPKIILNQHGVHDNNLEVYFQTIQSSSYQIPGDPEQYKLVDLPKGISAQRIDERGELPYRVILGIHSLQQGRFGIIIEQVVLVVKQKTAMPSPLRVWTEGEPRDYRNNLFQALYRGEEAGARLLVVYLSRPDGHVQLIPGESDELGVQVMSRVTADLHFQVQIIYRVVNESQDQVITLPNEFEVIFSNASNWYPYHLKNGRFVAGP